MDISKEPVPCIASCLMECVCAERLRRRLARFALMQSLHTMCVVGSGPCSSAVLLVAIDMIGEALEVPTFDPCCTFPFVVLLR